MTALLAVVMFVLAAMAVDVGRWYSEGQRVQRTVDAAALSGVPYLPGDLARAREEARALITANGYDGAAVPDSDITFGDRRTQLRVTLTSTIANSFGTVVGADFKSVTRTAVAEFTPPATLGSSCNVLGTDPPDSTGGTAGSAACSSADFWNNIAGPDAQKANGDQFASRRCEPSDSNCSGGANLDYFGGDEVFGQPYYVYRIRATSAVSALRVEAFDPVFVDVGDFCQRNLEATADGQWAAGTDPDSPNPFVTDAASRYSWGVAAGTDVTFGQVSAPGARWSGEFCTGDVLLGGDAADLTTSFLVLNPTDTQDPFAATPACSPQSFPGYSGDLTEALVADDPGYRQDIAQSFRQWVGVCTITSPKVGQDYYLLVRTNVPAGASADRMLDPSEDASTSGYGQNRFGLRVVDTAGNGTQAATISAVERMSILANQLPGSPNFDLVRVPSANAGSQMTVTFFDVGESWDPTSARISITGPSGTAPAGCRAAGDVRTSPTGDFDSTTCTLTGIGESEFNGRIQRIQVPIPDDYACDDTDPDDCWYRLTISYPAGAVNDLMTWQATFDADRVRLVE